MAEWTVVDKEANLRWPPSRRKLAGHGDRRARLIYDGPPSHRSVVS
jgi:hypothetical protein